MKVVAAQQPVYLPCIRFFAQMIGADAFILADDLQYTKHSVINRTRIKNAEGWQWLTVPVFSKGRLGQPIRDVEIDPTTNWSRRHWKTIQVNYRHAAYFELWADELQAIYSRPWNRLVDLNLALIELARAALRIDTPLRLSSELSVQGKGTDRLIQLCRAVEADAYLLPSPEAATFVDEERFRQAGIELRSLQFEHPVYHQLFGPFIPDLSILDLLLNEGEQSREIIDAACGGPRPGPHEKPR